MAIRLRVHRSFAKRFVSTYRTLKIWMFRQRIYMFILLAVVLLVFVLNFNTLQAFVTSLYLSTPVSPSLNHFNVEKQSEQKCQLHATWIPRTIDNVSFDGLTNIAPACVHECQYTWDTAHELPPTHFSQPISEMICQLNFRSLADWVYNWPWDRSGEQTMWLVPDAMHAVPCLFPGAIIYTHVWQLDNFADEVLPLLRHPFILLSGEDDKPPSYYSSFFTIANHPLLIKWFAQNLDFEHYKMRNLPIGLNCIEHGDAVSQFLYDIVDEHDLTNSQCGSQLIPLLEAQPIRWKESPLVLVNWGFRSHPDRQPLWEHFCNGPTPENSPPWMLCHLSDYRIGISLSEMYFNFSQVPFWISPEGIGVDCHRTWEAIYSNSIAVIQHSHLSPLYIGDDLPVLILDSLWDDINESLFVTLLEAYKVRHFSRRSSTLQYWFSEIKKELMAAGYALTGHRRRCWGPHLSDLY